jgi:hypothetical protein
MMCGLSLIRKSDTIATMFLIQLLVGKIWDWLLELPPELFGRKIEQALDRAAERRRRRKSRRSTRSTRSSPRNNKRIV